MSLANLSQLILKTDNKEGSKDITAVKGRKITNFINQQAGQHCRDGVFVLCALSNIFYACRSLFLSSNAKDTSPSHSKQSYFILSTYI